MKVFHILLIFLMCLATAADAKPRKKQRLYSPNPAYSSIVIDAHTGKVLHNEGADNITYPASLTKMMTLYLLFEALENGKISHNHKFRVSVNASRQGPTKLYLKPGEIIAVRDALLGIMTKSANDASVVVAEGLAGSEANFAARMNIKAKSLGMTNTHFCNASGLPNPNQKTTARDMAILSLALYKHYPRYYSYFQTKNFKFKGNNHANHNHLLGNVPGVDGIKTGWIIASGWNLSASAVRSGKRVIAVVLGGKTRLWRDKRVTELLDVGFNKLGVVNNNGVPIPEERPEPVVQNAATEPPVQQAEVTAPIANQKAPLPKMKPASLPEKTVQAIAGKWGVQVGAFGSQKKAQEVAAKVKQEVSALSTAKVVINPIKHTRGKLYQTRFVNLPENVARKVCSQVVKKGHSCMAMKVVK